MGVIKNFDFGRTPPIFRSSEESLPSIGLSVPSTPPSEPEETSTEERNRSFNPCRRDPALLIQRLEQISRKRTGARKARREGNAQALQTLAESDGETSYHTPTIDDFIPCTNSPFTKLMTDYNCMMVWEFFLSQSEEEQKEYLIHIAEARKKKCESMNLGIHFTQARNKEGELDTSLKDDNARPKPPMWSPEKRFSQVESRLRSVLKRRKTNLGVLSFLENDVISVFDEDDDAVYVSRELNTYERLLLHGISQYHLLKSWSINVAESRRTKVENKKLLFSHPKTTLTEFLEKRHQMLGRS